jgi:hypothetical protein
MRSDPTSGSLHLAVVHGHVTSGSSVQPVPLATVRLAVHDEQGQFIAAARGHTDSQGAYEIPLRWRGTPTPALHFEVWAPGHAHISGFPRSHPDSPDALRIEKGQRVPLDLTVPPGFALEITVVNHDGKALEDARASVILAGDGFCFWPLQDAIASGPPHDPRSDAEGRMLIEGFAQSTVAGSRYVVVVRHKDHPDALLQAPEKLPRKAGKARAAIRMLPGVTFAGRVVDKRDGYAVQGARVEAYLDADDPRVPACHRIGRSEVTDLEGRFRIAGLQEACHNVTVSHPDWQPIASPALAIDGEGEFEFRLQRGPVVTGRVLDADGRAVEGVAVGARPVKPAAADVRCKTDADGWFTLVLPEGRLFHLFARDEKRQAFYGFRKIKAENQAVMFDLRAAVHVEARVLDPRTGQPIRHKVCAWASVEGEPTLLASYAEGSADDGVVRIPLPPQGQFTLTRPRRARRHSSRWPRWRPRRAPPPRR